jgi:hypothetical protein
VAASFPSLRYDDIDAAIDSSPRIIGIAHGVHDQGATGLGALHEGARITPKERYDRHAFLKAGLKSILLGKFHIQIYGKGFGGD